MIIACMAAASSAPALSQSQPVASDPVLQQVRMAAAAAAREDAAAYLEDESVRQRPRALTLASLDDTRSIPARKRVRTRS